MTNIWLMGSFPANPYYETAFQIAGIWRDEADLMAIQTVIMYRRQGLKRMGPEFYPLGPRYLEESDLNRAEEILLKPNRRILEDLLEHAPEHLLTGQIERFRARLAVPPPADEVTVRHLAFLRRVVQDFALDVLSNLPAVNVPPWPVDLDPVLPFGWQEDEQL